MNYTEEQIINKARQIIKDLKGKYYSDELIGKAFFQKEETLPFEKNKEQKHPVWTISVEAIFDNVDFLLISDETGEPLYYHNFNTYTFKIVKNSEGKYYKVE